jgi:hypothetical protein
MKNKKIYSTQKIGKICSLFSLSLENVLERLELAELYKIKSLYSSCGKMIQRNMTMLKTDAKWMALKMKSPELVISILEEFAEQFEKLLRGNYGHLNVECRSLKFD